MATAKGIIGAVFIEERRQEYEILEAEFIKESRG